MTEVQPNPELSIVIPVRNGMPYLRAALESVLESENLPAMEVIVRENFSTDGTAEWLKTQVSDRVRVVIADADDSAAQNWTAVCALARGKYVKLLCADDFVLPGGLSRQWAAARANPDVAMVASRRNVVDSAGKVLVRGHGLRGFSGRRPGARAVRKSLFTGVNPFGEPSSVLFRADALKASLPFESEYPYVTDIDMYTRVLRHGDFLGLKSIDAAFRVSNTSWSASIGRGQLREFRGWVRSFHDSGEYPLSWVERLAADTVATMMFIARRLVSWAIGLRRRPA